MKVRKLIRRFLALPDRNRRAALITIAAVALAVRIGFALTMRQEFYFPDSRRYSEVAENLLNGKGFVCSSAWAFLPFPDEHTEPFVAASPPGYPAFLAGCYLIAGKSILFVRVVHAFLGAGACLLIYCIGSTLFDRKTGFAAGLMCAVYPFLVFFSGLVLSEALFALLLCAFMLAALKITERPSAALGVVCGLLAACVTQVRSSFLLFPVFLLPVLLWRAEDKKKFLASYACILISMAVFLAPWTLRNRRLLGHSVVTTTRGGMGLFEGNAEGADGAPRLVGTTPWPEEIAAMGEYERDAYLRAWTKRIILEQPGRFALLALRKAARTWNVVINFSGYSTPFYNTVSVLSYVPIMLLALAAIFKERRGMKNWAVLLMPALYFTAMHMVFIGSIRYRVPVMPFIIVLSAFALSRFVSGEEECSSA